MKKHYFLLLIFCVLSIAMKDKPAYLLYNEKGKIADYDDLLKAAKKADIVLFGEQHNNPICHWLQLQLTKDLYADKQKDLILAAEMFETDAQLVLNEYLSGLIKEGNFEKESKIWNNYATDYKPLVNFAKQNGLPFVASNIPRRYAAAVAATGLGFFDKLTDEAKKNYLMPLPVEVDVELPQYKNMLTMMGGHGSTNIIYAQAVKDASMAYKISQAWQKNKLVLHFHGTYHSDRYEGIVWYLKKYNPSLKILTISSLDQENIEKLDEKHQGIADFIICLPADMTKTF